MSDTLLESALGRPSCIAVILCNEIIEDKLTNNKTLVSLFNRVLTAQVPSNHPRMFVMASFAEGAGDWPVAISFRSPSGAEIMRFEGEVHFEDPLDVADVVVELRGLPLNEFGTHEVNVEIDGSLAATRRFVVLLAD
jgi:hypothetical protein